MYLITPQIQITFQIHAYAQHLKELLKNNIHTIEQVRCIHIYYKRHGSGASDQDCFLSKSDNSEKFQFHVGTILDGQLENAETKEALNPFRPVDRTTIDNVITNKSERIQEKQKMTSASHSPEANRLTDVIQSPSSSAICTPCSELIIKNKVSDSLILYIVRPVLAIKTIF